MPPAYFVKDEMQNRRLIVDGLTILVNGFDVQHARFN